jgi:hypothetical protein
MGRSVQVDETIQQYAEGRVQSRVAAEVRGRRHSACILLHPYSIQFLALWTPLSCLQVGILVGRCAPGKDLVLQALRTPERVGSNLM